jgi:hypothetical protein
MNWNELLNPWAALKRAKIEIRVLRREQEMLVEDLKKAQRNDREFHEKQDNAKKTYTQASE